MIWSDDMSDFSMYSCAMRSPQGFNWQKSAFDQVVVQGRIGRNKLLPKPVVTLSIDT